MSPNKRKRSLLHQLTSHVIKPTLFHTWTIMYFFYFYYLFSSLEIVKHTVLFVALQHVYSFPYTIFNCGSHVVPFTSSWPRVIPSSFYAQLIFCKCQSPDPRPWNYSFMKLVKLRLLRSTLIYTPITCLDTCMFFLTALLNFSYASPTLSEMEAAVLSIFILHQVYTYIQ